MEILFVFEFGLSLEKEQNSMTGEKKKWAIAFCISDVQVAEKSVASKRGDKFGKTRMIKVAPKLLAHVKKHQFKYLFFENVRLPMQVL